MMRRLLAVALGAALLLSGCVVYPLHGYGHGDHAAYRDHDYRGDRDRAYDRGRDGYWRYDRGDRP